MAEPLTYNEADTLYNDPGYHYDGSCIGVIIYNESGVTYNESLVTYGGCDHRGAPPADTFVRLHLGRRRALAPRSHGIRVPA